jgi:hypothetical protein
LKLFVLELLITPASFVAVAALIAACLSLSYSKTCLSTSCFKNSVYSDCTFLFAASLSFKANNS